MNRRLEEFSILLRRQRRGIKISALIVADILMLKELTKDQIGIKAAGGIRTHDRAVELILAGATRLGTSWGIELLKQREKDPEDEA